MDVKRKIAMAAAVVAVALGAGHLMQNGFGDKPVQTASATVPKAITPLAAGLGNGAAVPSPTLPQQPAIITPELPEVALMPEVAPAEPLSGDSTNCPISLDLTAGPKAMIDVTLLAPCRANERVVLRHGGLAFTGRTSLTGALFAVVPAMEEDAIVSILFGDGQEAIADINLPDLPIYHRIAVQWQAEDSFQLHALEDGASYGGKGHISAANPQSRLGDVPSKTGFLTQLGDATVDLPLLAEVYTFPLDSAVSVDISVEVPVTAATCNREMLGELLLSEAGRQASTDLTLATPECDAIGDVLVLNNLLPDLKLATAN